MCEPVMIGLAIASSVMQVKAQADQGRDQRRANSAQAKIQREEVRDANETKIADRNRAARRDRARSRVAAAEAGVGGQSFSLAIKQSRFAQDLDAARINKNTFFATRRIQSQLRSSNAATAQPGALDFVNAGLSGYSSGLQINAAIADAR